MFNFNISVFLLGESHHVSEGEHLMFLFCYSLHHLSFSKGYWSFSYHKTFFLNLSFLLSLCYFPYFCLTQKLNFIFGGKDCF